MAEMRDKHKVQVKRWSDKDLAAFEKAWLEVITEELAKDPLFKKVADHYLDYRKKYAIWGDLAGHEADLPRQVSASAQTFGRRRARVAPAYAGGDLRAGGRDNPAARIFVPLLACPQMRARGRRARE